MTEQKRPHINRLSTGIPFLDRLLGGGQRTPGVHGLLGPIGSGKSTLGAMLAAEGALHELDVEKQGGEAGTWILLQFGMAPSESILLALSHAARIERDVVRSAVLGGELRGPNDADHFIESAFADEGRRRDYENRRSSDLQDPEGGIPCERERFYEVLPAFTNHLHILARTEAPLRGWSPIDPIRQQICVERCAGIVIDGILQLAAKVAEDNPVPVKGYSDMIRNLVVGCRDRLAIPFNCPVWLLHHTTARFDVNPPNKLCGYHDVAECKQFADHLDACVVLGTRDRTTGHFLAHTTKTIDTQPYEQVRLKFDDDFASIVEVARGATPNRGTNVEVTDDATETLRRLEAAEDELSRDQRVAGEDRTTVRGAHVSKSRRDTKSSRGKNLRTE